MTLQKQDCGVWVKAREEKPEANKKLPLRVDGKYWIGHMMPYGDNHFWLENAIYNSVHPNNVEWLKPLKDVYVLTEEEINDIKMIEYNRGYSEGIYQAQIPF